MCSPSRFERKRKQTDEASVVEVENSTGNISEQRKVIVNHFDFDVFSPASVYLNQCHKVLGTRQKKYIDLPINVLRGLSFDIDVLS